MFRVIEVKSGEVLYECDDRPTAQEVIDAIVEKKGAREYRALTFQLQSDESGEWQDDKRALRDRPPMKLPKTEKERKEIQAEIRAGVVARREARRARLLEARTPTEPPPPEDTL